MSDSSSMAVVPITSSSGMYSQKPPQPPKKSDQSYQGLLQAEQDPITAGLVSSYLNKYGVPSGAAKVVEKRRETNNTLRNSGY